MRHLWLYLLLLAPLLALSACGDDAPEEHAHDEATGELWTCGMHPEVIQDGPGTCPICGMDLTPLRQAGAPATGEREILYWVAPMDPNYIREGPGKSPMGMDLVPVYSDEITPGSGPVVVDPAVVQSMGVRTAVAREQTIFRHLRTVGEVEVGEDQVSVVNLRFSGWVERLWVERTGDEVAAGQVLFEVYSPELVAAQEEYLLALERSGAASPLAVSARRKLELAGIWPVDIDAVVAAGRASRTLNVRSPASGYVLHKAVVSGARVGAGQDLYRIGNLAKIWVTAEVYEYDAPWIEVGQPARMSLSFQQGAELPGRVSYIYPTLNPTSRTLTVRLEFDNPGVKLKPGMFATVRIEYRRLDDVLAILIEAVLHSGERELVFVALGQGRFAPRESTTGLVADHHMTEVLAGLDPGEEIVLSGQFLLDSESQLQEALAKLLSIRGGAAPAEAADAVWSCPMHPEVVEDGPGHCPKCGMDLIERAATLEDLHRREAP